MKWYFKDDINKYFEKKLFIKKLLLILIWFECKKITLMWGKKSLENNDPWINTSTFITVVCSENIFKMMTSYDIIFMEKEWVWGSH